MSEPYVGECRLVGFNFQVNGWNYCNGAILSIAENSVLFQLIGTTYGGDGQQTFAVPDLQGRVPVHQGAGYVIGQRAGAETVTLSTQQMPVHNHTAAAATAGAQSNNPQGNLPGYSATSPLYVDPAPAPGGTMTGMIGVAGGNQPHDNMQPFLVMNWIISLFGIFPSQN